jgi:hypothetical protein
VGVCKQKMNGRAKLVSKTAHTKILNKRNLLLPVSDVPVWLKSLRLHKYTRMFQEMTYDEMMALNDQKLEERQVTKGARRKILQSLLKLRDRSQLIRQLEKVSCLRQKH